MPKPPIESRGVVIAGPAGNLEALVEAGPEPAEAVAVVCHPHPLHQGTMNNKVVHTLCRSFARLGAAAVRFNFRGVGRSAGRHADGEGELDDAAAVVAWAREQWPGAGLYLGGFSFGAGVALRIARARRARGLVTVAPPVTRLPAHIEHPQCPWLLIQGTDDDVVLATDVRTWAERLAPPPDIHAVTGAGHFFHGRLAAITDAVTAFFGPALHAADRER